MVEIIKAVSSNARMIIMDEPTFGIDANWQSIIRGLIIIGTVMLDMLINGRNRS